MGRYLAGLVAVVALVAGATTVGYRYWESETSTKGSGVPDPSDGVIAGDLSGGPVRLSGTANLLQAERTSFHSLALPLSITTSERGLGQAGGTFTGVLVDGEESTISWDAGTPLELQAPDDNAAAAIEVRVVGLEVRTDGSTVAFLDDEAYGLAPGTYVIATSVAVGSGGGLAEPVDSVTFEATATSTVSFRGRALTTVPAGPTSLQGDGALIMAGSLRLTGADGIARPAVQGLAFTGGFSLELTPQADGQYAVTGQTDAEPRTS